MILQICSFSYKIVVGVERDWQETFGDSGNGRGKKNRDQFYKSISLDIGLHQCIFRFLFFCQIVSLGLEISERVRKSQSSKNSWSKAVILVILTAFWTLQSQPPSKGDDLGSRDHRPPFFHHLERIFQSNFLVINPSHPHPFLPLKGREIVMFLPLQGGVRRGMGICRSSIIMSSQLWPD